MVNKELELFFIGYNLIRALIVQSTHANNFGDSGVKDASLRAVRALAQWTRREFVGLALGSGVVKAGRHSHVMKNVTISLLVAVAVVALFVVPRWKEAQRAKKFDDYFEKQYAALGKTTEEILSHENATNVSAVLGALHWRIGQKAHAHGEKGLTDTERRLLAAYWVEGEVKNGGFDQYFFNSAGLR